MKTRNIPGADFFFSQANLLRISIFIALAVLVIIPLFMVSSASSPGNGVGAPSERRGRKEPNLVANQVKGDLAAALKRLPLFSTLTLVPQSSSPGIVTFDDGCVNQQSDFVLGEEVCGRATGGLAAPRRVAWIDPSGNSRQIHPITADPQDFSFDIPATQTSVVDGQTVNNRGTWKVNIISNRGSVVATTPFVVTEPANPIADVSVNKFAENSEVSAGSSGTFFIFVHNSGPDSAQNVVLTDVLPDNTTFSAIVQSSGPQFSCTTPPVGSSGTLTCSIASLARGDSAAFDLAYQVNPGTAAGTQITNTATVSSGPSDPADPDSNNNSSTASARVTSAGGGGTNTCTVACPDDIATSANTTQGGEDGAIVHFSPPSGNEECGVVTANHCNDCFFPVGITTVTGTATTGESCSFTVTVTPPPSGTAPTISCPSNRVATADSNCQATVDPGQPTTTGENVTVTGTRSDERPLSDPFPSGTTTITWTATNSAGSVQCQQTITVNDVTPPTIDAPDGTTESANVDCLAAIPDFTGGATTSDNCPGVSVSQEPEAGSLVGVGQHTITLTASDESGNTATDTTTFTVNDTTAPTVAAPADSSADGDASCQAPVPDYTAGTETSDNCDSSLTVTQSPAAGTMVGGGPHTVTVTATDDAGNSGSDTVVFTVNDVTPPTVTAPADSSASADASCQAPVPNYAAGSTASDSCGNPTVTQSPAAGTLVGKGSHTVTVTATDAAGNSSSDTVTFTVNDTTPPVISCPANITQPTDPGSCSATVNPGTATATDNCGTVTVTGSRSDGQPLNAPYPAGTTTITWTATDGSGNQSSCTQTVTVNAPAATTLGPANIWVGLKNSDSVGLRFDLLAEVYKNDQLIGSGQINNVPGGSSGFNNAILRTIAIAQSQGATFCAGNQLKIKLWVRAGVTGHVSGYARLWYNDAAANSRFDVTIDGNTNTYYLLDGFVTGSAPGPGPKKTIDVFVHRNQNGNAFKLFGTWVKTF